MQNKPNIVQSPHIVAPRISVVMPSYNQRQFIERSILSIINQNYPNLEFIIIDGGSNDGTVDILRKYEKYLEYWISESDNGQSNALNKGFAHASGDIYGWLNSDDLYMPLAFERAVDMLSKHPEKSIVFGDWLNIDSDDLTIDRQYAFDFNINQFKYEGFHLNAQSMFWRKEVHQRFGGYLESLYNTMDYQMILVFGINEGNAAFLRIPEVLGCFRHHAEQKTQSFSDAVFDEHRLMANRYGYSDKYTPKGKAKRILYRFRRAYWYAYRGGISFFIKKLNSLIWKHKHRKVP
jgi:glycosyltransferase involved in cell wall biosynthesis